MNNFIKHLQKTFRTDTEKGRAMFMFTTYFLYWLVFYGLWFAPVFLSSISDVTEIGDNQDLEVLFTTVQILAPFALVFLSMFISKVIKISRTRITIYSVIVFVISAIYVFYAILTSIGKSYTGF